MPSQFVKLSNRARSMGNRKKVTTMARAGRGKRRQTSRRLLTWDSPAMPMSTSAAGEMGEGRRQASLARAFRVRLLLHRGLGGLVEGGGCLSGRLLVGADFLVQLEGGHYGLGGNVLEPQPGGLLVGVQFVPVGLDPLVQ